MKKKQFNAQKAPSCALFSTAQCNSGSDNLHPRFSMEFLSGDFCLSRCEKRERSDFSTKSHRISKSSWGDLRRMGRDSGFETIPVNELRCKIPDAFVDQQEAIVFHMAQNIPIIGFRSEECVFYVIAIDRCFRAYDHGK